MKGRGTENNMDTGNYHTDLLADLYKARLAWKSARETLYNEPGHCANLGHWDEDQDITCFQRYRDRGQWCEFCRRREPLWKAYQKASAKAGAALRACLMEGKYIAELK